MFFVSYESLQCALKNLAPIIQNFLLQLSLETYKIKFIDGISTTISMTNDTLDIFRMEKYEVLQRRIKKQRYKTLLHQPSTRNETITTSTNSEVPLSEEQQHIQTMLSIMKKSKPIIKEDNNTTNDSSIIIIIIVL